MDDALSRLLHDVRPAGALFDRSTLRPPWSLRIVEAAPLTLLTMLSGDAWLRPGAGEPVRLGTQDVAVVVGAEPYEVADTPEGAPLVVVHGDERCKVGTSRAAFAKRFSELVGQPPMAYVTEWRLCLAADLLRQTDATVDTIARRVGYANGYALSVAFHRTQGIRPSRYRSAGPATATAGRP